MRPSVLPRIRFFRSYRTQLIWSGGAFNGLCWFSVTCVIMQKTGAGLHTASSCYWDNTTDGEPAGISMSTPYSESNFRVSWLRLWWNPYCASFYRSRELHRSMGEQNYVLHGLRLRISFLKGVCLFESLISFELRSYSMLLMESTHTHRNNMSGQSRHRSLCTNSKEKLG